MYNLVRPADSIKWAEEKDSFISPDELLKALKASLDHPLMSDLNNVSGTTEQTDVPSNDYCPLVFHIHNGTNTPAVPIAMSIGKTIIPITLYDHRVINNVPHIDLRMFIEALSTLILESRANNVESYQEPLVLYLNPRYQSDTNIRNSGYLVQSVWSRFCKTDNILFEEGSVKYFVQVDCDDLRCLGSTVRNTMLSTDVNIIMHGVSVYQEHFIMSPYTLLTRLRVLNNHFKCDYVNFCRRTGSNEELINPRIIAMYFRTQSNETSMVSFSDLVPSDSGVTTIPLFALVNLLSSIEDSKSEVVTKLLSKQMPPWCPMVFAIDDIALEGQGVSLYVIDSVRVSFTEFSKLAGVTIMMCPLHYANGLGAKHADDARRIQEELRKYAESMNATINADLPALAEPDGHTEKD